MTPGPDERRAAATANVLGALALVVADQTVSQSSAVCGQTGAASAALVALDQFLGRPSQEQLAGVLALTSSGAARLVDRLIEDGLVSRRPGRDDRTRSIALTAKGRALARRIGAMRAAYLRSLVAALAPDEQRELHRLSSKLLGEVVAQKEGGPWMCRYCDVDDCGRAAGECPAANAALAKYGPAAQETHGRP